MIEQVVRYSITMWVSITVVFFLFRSMPGDPFTAYLDDLREEIGGQEIVMEMDRYIEMYGLDKPLLTQYVNFLSNLILKGDLGPSLIGFPTHAQVHIMRALPWTLALLCTATVIAWGLGVILGTLSGWTRGRVDSVISSVALVFSQVPFYYLAVILMLTLGFMLHWFPTSGAYSPRLTPNFSLEFILDYLRHATLPASALVLTQVAVILLTQRSLVVMILGEDYLTLAEAKGLKRAWILNKYVLRNSLLPQMTALAIRLGFAVNGSIVLESIFTYPGIGTLFVYALNTLDYNVIQGVIMITIFSVLTANLLIELIVSLVDPRVRTG